MLRQATLASSADFLMRVDHLLALLAAHRRHLQADHLAVVVGRHAQVAGADRLLDVLEDARVERPDDDLLRVGRADLGQLLQRRRRAVVLDAQAVHQGRRGPAGAQAAQLVAEDVDRLLHALFGVEQDFVACHGRSVSLRYGSPCAVSLTRVPMGWPAMARSMLPSRLKLKTRIGSFAFAAQADGGHVHHAQIIAQHLAVSQLLVADGVRIHLRDRRCRRRPRASP